MLAECDPKYCLGQRGAELESLLSPDDSEAKHATETTSVEVCLAERRRDMEERDESNEQRAKSKSGAACVRHSQCILHSESREGVEKDRLACYLARF